MNGRLWYPQLDVYDAVRRMLVLLYAWTGNPPGLERFFISDFYLANPPLLHNISMTAAIRAEFLKLPIPRPEKTFLSYPMAPLLFHKMEPIQKKALQALIGKGLIDSSLFQKGLVRLSEFGTGFVERELLEETSRVEEGLLSFLTMQLSTIGEGSTVELRKRTGLRRFV